MSLEFVLELVRLEGTLWSSWGPQYNFFPFWSTCKT